MIDIAELSRVFKVKNMQNGSSSENGVFSDCGLGRSSRTS